MLILWKDWVCCHLLALCKRAEKVENLAADKCILLQFTMIAKVRKLEKLW